jgi:hypothetical protein
MLATTVMTLVFWLAPDGTLDDSNRPMTLLSAAALGVIQAVLLQGLVGQILWVLATTLGQLVLMISFAWSVWAFSSVGAPIIFSMGALLLALVQWGVLALGRSLRRTLLWVPATVSAHVLAYMALREAARFDSKGLLPWHPASVIFALCDGLATGAATSLALQAMLRHEDSGLPKVRPVDP